MFTTRHNILSIRELDLNEGEEKNVATLPESFVPGSKTRETLA
jgi:hypothetical protein